ncbi:MAG: hypothetical protein HY897_15520, partial [Deltaproteobacteria bacterium]|nr:hypothetical protein [Deltaproteobacteria bacterium]
MNRRNVMLLVLALASLAAATYAASCHCGNPDAGVGAPGAKRSAPVSSPDPRALSEPRASASGAGGPLAYSRHALTSSVTTDADFLTANRGYGIVEDTSVSAGNIRRTLGLPNFGLANVNPTVTGWQTTTPLPTARYGAASVVNNGFLYSIGGNDGTNYLDEVKYARINADGSIGAWANTIPFSSPREFATAVAHNGYLYLLGGNDSTNSFNDVQFSKVNQDGSLASWTTVSSFTNGRSLHQSVVHNENMYVIGGFGGSRFKDVQFAKISTDGTLGSWTPTTDLPDNLAGHASFVFNGKLFVAGGWNNSTGQTLISLAPFKANGSLGSWSPAGDLPTARLYHTCQVYNGFVYVAGGRDNSYQSLDDVQFAPISLDGTVGGWTPSTNLPGKREHHSSVIGGGFLYVVGGSSTSGPITPVPTVLFAP